MSEHSHIDKIFKQTIGEKDFSNVDAMWQRMEDELGKKDGKRKKPVILVIASIIAFLITSVFIVKHRANTDVEALAAHAGKHTIASNGNSKIANKSLSTSTETISSDKKQSLNPAIHSPGTELPLAGETWKRQLTYHQVDFPASSIVPIDGVVETNPEDYVTEKQGEQYLEKITAAASLTAAPAVPKNRSVLIPSAAPLGLGQSFKKQVAKEKVHRSNNITIEAVGGGDIIRMNRKAGFYAGLRMNKKLDKGTSFSVGINFASHVIKDRYRIKTKPAEQLESDARINSISSVRIPVYLHRQMGSSKFSMMVGLVPTYITEASIYNVPNSYVGNPDPYRKFGLQDINRFNLLFGSGIKFSPTNWVALELSGSYGLTGMVKDGYKNLSRVNDNFKSIQMGVAFRLK